MSKINGTNTSSAKIASEESSGTFVVEEGEAEGEPVDEPEGDEVAEVVGDEDELGVASTELLKSVCAMGFEFSPEAG